MSPGHANSSANLRQLPVVSRSPIYPRKCLDPVHEMLATMKKTGSFGALIHAPAHLELSAPWKIAVRLGVLLAILLASTAQARQDADPDTQRQAAILLDRTTGTSPTARAEAARRLVQKRTPAARQVLAGALQERGNPPAQLAAAVALAEDDRPDPSLIDPLFVLTKPDVPLALARPAARALSRYSGNLAVLARLIDRIEDRRGDSRRAAVEALGYFSEKRAAERLIALLNSEDESRAIRDSAVATDEPGDPAQQLHVEARG